MIIEKELCSYEELPVVQEPCSPSGTGASTGTVVEESVHILVEESVHILVCCCAAGDGQVVGSLGEVEGHTVPMEECSHVASQHEAVRSMLYLVHDIIFCLIDTVIVLKY